MLNVLLWCSLSSGVALGGGAEEERVPQTVTEHVREKIPGATGVKRVPRQDVGPYQAFEIGRISAGPGDPGALVIYAKDGNPLEREGGDWSEFLGAAPPAQVAEALALPLDTVFRPSGPQAQNKYHALHRLPESIRNQVVDPKRQADGALQFFVQDGRGDPPSDDVYRVVVTAASTGGLKTTREQVRPTPQ